MLALLLTIPFVCLFVCGSVWVQNMCLCTHRYLWWRSLSVCQHIQVWVPVCLPVRVCMFRACTVHLYKSACKYTCAYCCG